MGSRPIAEALKQYDLGYLPIGALDHTTNPEPRKWQYIAANRTDDGPLHRVISAIRSPVDACQDAGRINSIANLLAAVHTDESSTDALTDTQKIDRIRSLLG
ncbi:hypothetical protein [Nocardia tengchongensis]|uniref:hypothetical protein n=1 Tax=Nocardia tengchongensis TaxID=2055889 RepID=UPI0036AD9DB4